MQSVYRHDRRPGADDATGFIVGESGTGKELAAEAIHAVRTARDGNSSPSTAAPFPAN
jgi:two-component system repressor protein LuxO